MIWLAAAVLATWFLIMPVYFSRNPRMTQALRLAVKAVPTALAALFALIAYSHGGETYALLIFIGLCVCTAADVLLGIQFIVGGALFLTGHIFYMTALGGLHTLSGALFPVALIAYAGLALFLRRYFPLFPHKLLIAGVLVYALALGLLLGFSLPLPFSVLSQRNVLAALGAALFVLSDMGTCHTILANPGRTFDYCSLGTYYTAQLLLGMSAFA